MLVLKLNDANLVTTPSVGRATLYINDQGALSVLDSNGDTQVLSFNNPEFTGNMIVDGNITATAGHFFIGDGGLLSNISGGGGNGTAIVNGTSNVVVASNGNITIGSAGVANIAIFTSTGANIGGTLNVTGDATLGNLVTANFFSGDGSLLTNIRNQINKMFVKTFNYLLGFFYFIRFSLYLKFFFFFTS